MSAGHFHSELIYWPPTGMDTNRLPFVSPWFFVQQMSRPQRWLLGLLGVVVATAAALFLFAYSFPWHWALDIDVLADTQSEPAYIKTISQSYRNIDLYLPAFRQWLSYSAGMIAPHPLPLWLFWAVQLVCWGFLLGMATQVPSRWVYAIYLLYTFFLFFSGVSQALFPQDTWRLAALGVILAHLVPAYLFQVKILRWPLWGRVLTILVIEGVFFGIVAARGDWSLLYRMSGESYYYLIVLTLALLFVLGKAPTSLIFLLTTNHREQRRRWDPRLILVLVLALLFVEYIWLDELLNINALGIRLPFRPLHLLVLSALLSPMLYQHLFPHVRVLVGDRFVFTMAILAWCGIVLGFLFHSFTLGEPLFVHTIERLAAIFFGVIGLAHAFFVFANHRELLIRRVNLYYLLAQGPRFGLAVVWLLGVAGLVFGEGREGWKSINLLVHSGLCRMADEALLYDKTDLAMSLYERAAEVAQSSTKAHHNLAALTLADPTAINRALRYYRRAGGKDGFAPARINAANLLALHGQRDEARKLLHDTWARTSDPRSLVNLGTLYARAAQPDSAIEVFRQALLADPSLAPGYTNLAFVYWDNERRDEARQFFELAAQQSDPSVRTNLAFYQLHDSSLRHAAPRAAATDFFYDYNHILGQLQRGRTATRALQRDWVRELGAYQEAPDALLLSGYVQFDSDSAMLALSRLKYVAQAYPAYAARAYFLLGLTYFEREVPEMARAYFEAAGQAGEPAGYLQAARMQIDEGKADSAFLRLGDLWSQYPQLKEACAREQAILLAAYGQPVVAEANWPRAQLSFEEKVRISRYADSMNAYVTALENFRQLIDEDSTTVIPYLEMGRIYNKYRDTLALENLAYGLQKDSANVSLRLAYARALLYRGDRATARQYLESVAIGTAAERDRLLLAADLAWADGDTVLADTLLQQVLTAWPFDRETSVLLGTRYLDRGEYARGMAVVNQALDYNSRHPGLWLLYARLARVWGLPTEAAYGARQAASLNASPAARQAILAEFAAEIAAAATP
ncbi:MAG: hypothetical protein OHK0039_02370 [Bacteroidia bacterium]